jgi:hypothetical protein
MKTLEPKNFNFSDVKYFTPLQLSEHYKLYTNYINCINNVNNALHKVSRKIENFLL